MRLNFSMLVVSLCAIYCGQPALASEVQLRPAIDGNSVNVVPSNVAPSDVAPSDVAPSNVVPSDVVRPGAGSIPLPSNTSAPKPTSREAVKLDTFFQLSPSSQAIAVDKSVADIANPEPISKKTGASNFLWHVLDNLGVPISKGNHDPAIDPRIKEKMALPPYQNTATLRDAATSRDTGTSRAATTSGDAGSSSANTSRGEGPSGAASSSVQPSQTTPPVLHKIPESELQGLDPVLQNDVQTK